MPPETNELPLPVPLTVRWTSDGQPPQRHVNEASFSYIGDQVFLTFGEVQGPSVVKDGGPDIPEVIVQESVRVVCSEGAFHKILELLNRVAPNVRNPNLLRKP